MKTSEQSIEKVDQRRLALFDRPFFTMEAVVAQLVAINDTLKELVAALRPEPKVEEESVKEEPIKEDSIDDPEDFAGFMERYFATEAQLEVMDICRKYKEIFNHRLTRAAVIGKLVPFGWTVKNRSGKMFAIRPNSVE